MDRTPRKRISRFFKSSDQKHSATTAVVPKLLEDQEDTSSIPSAYSHLSSPTSSTQSSQLSAETSLEHPSQHDTAPTELFVIPDRPVQAVGIALYSYSSAKPASLSFHKGSSILVFAKLTSGWWEGFCAQTGCSGWFPSNYILLIRDLSGSDSSTLQPSSIRQRASFYSSINPTASMTSSLNNYKSVDTMATSYSDAHDPSYWLPYVSDSGKLQFVNAERQHVSADLPFERVAVSSADRSSATTTSSMESIRRASYVNSLRSVDTTSLRTYATDEESIPDSLLIAPEIANAGTDMHAILPAGAPVYHRPSKISLSKSEVITPTDKYFFPCWESGLIVSQEVLLDDKYQTWTQLIDDLQGVCCAIKQDLDDFSRFLEHFSMLSSHIQRISLYAGIPVGSYPSLKECGVVSLSFRKMINCLVKIGIFNDILTSHDTGDDNTVPVRFESLVDALSSSATIFVSHFKDFYRREAMLRAVNHRSSGSSDGAEQDDKLPQVAVSFEVRHYAHNSYSNVFVKRDGTIDEAAENDRVNPVLARPGGASQSRRLSDQRESPQLPLENFSCILNINNEVVGYIEDRYRATQSVLDQVARMLEDKGSETPKSRASSQDKQKVLASSLHILVNLISSILTVIECFDLTAFYSCQLVTSIPNKRKNFIMTDTSQTMSHLYDLLAIKPRFYDTLYELSSVLKNMEGTEEDGLIAALSSQLESIKIEEIYESIQQSNHEKIRSSCSNLRNSFGDLVRIACVLCEEENAVLNAGRMMVMPLDSAQHLPNSMGVGDGFHGRYTAASTISLHSDEYSNGPFMGRPRNMSVSDTIKSGTSLTSSNGTDGQLWFLGLECGSEIIYDKKGGRRGGTMRALVEQLTLHSQFLSEFNTAMLLTFQSFSDASELLSLLIGRFMIQPPEGLTQEEFGIWTEKKQKPIRLRVINVLKSWLENYWLEDEVFVGLGSQQDVNELNEDAVDESRIVLFNSLMKFGQQIQSQKFPGASSLMNLIVRRMNHIEPWAKQQRHRIKQMRKGGGLSATPSPILPKNLKKFKLSEIDPLEMARQLSTRDFKLFVEITPYECLRRACRKTTFRLNKVIGGGTTSNPVVSNTTDMCITRLITNSNQLTNWVSYAILRHGEPKRRASSLKYFIEVADSCRNLKNFSSMTAIISALYSSTIHRMRKTWDYLPPKYGDKLENMNRLMNSSRNFNEYRDVLNIVTPPAVPFFGVYLSDLTFVDEGNPDFLNSERGIINFAKRNKAAHIIQSIRHFQMTPYPFEEVKDIQLFLDHGFETAPPIEEQYDTSLVFEPRNQRERHQEIIGEQITKSFEDNGIL